MTVDKGFGNEVQTRSEQNIKLCYQCLKCFSGCPVSRYMDYGPNAIIRMVQYGERQKVLSSHAIWLCVSCMTCGVRCPNGVDMSVVFDTLREMSREAGLSHKAERVVVILHEEFVRNVRIWGRLHEATFFLPHMIRSMDLFSNLPVGLMLFLRAKLPLIPKCIKGIHDIRRLFREGYKTRNQLAGKD